MIFPYVKVTRFLKHQKIERFLPWIRFGIYNPKNKYKILYPFGLVDSGSEITFVDHEFGEELGYDIKKGRKIEVIGIGGAKINIYLHKVGLLLDNSYKDENLSLEDLIGFSYNKFPPSMPQQTAILGTLAFFRHFNIAFNYPNLIKIENKFTSKFS